MPAGDPGALRATLRGLAEDRGRLERLQVSSMLAAQALTWDRCIAAYEGVLLEAVRSRYARLHGLRALPELDEPGPLTPGPDAVPPSGSLPDWPPMSVASIHLPEVSASSPEPGR